MLSETSTFYVINTMATPKILTASTSKAVPAAGYANGTTVRSETNSRTLVRLFAGAVTLSAIALAISGYLSYVAFTSTKILGCGGGVFNCDHVLTSKWSTFLGLPVAAWAGSMYLGVLTALIGTARVAVSTQPSLMRQWSWSIVTTAAVSAGLAAAWFIGLQAFVLEHYCPWCLGAHSCGILLCISTLCFAPLAGKTKAMCASLGFTATLGLVVMQLMAPEPLTYEIQDYPQTPLDGGVIEEPGTFDAPGSDGGDVFLAPDAQSSLPKADLWLAHTQNWARDWGSAVMSLTSPSLLLAGQVGTPAPAAAGQSNPPVAAAAAAPQSAAPQTAAVQAAAPQAAAGRTVHLSLANIKLRPEHWPMLGSPDAKHIFVEMYDYTCKHCRKTQKAMKGAREQLGDKLGVILLPVPLNRNCNPHAAGNPNANACELAELALSVWKAANNQEVFAGYHEWLLEGENPPSLADARAKAISLVGAPALDGAKESAQKFIKSNVDIYKRMNAGAVPKLIFATTVMTGEVQAPNVIVDTALRQP